MKKVLIPALTVLFLLSACNQKPADSTAPAAAGVARAELAPENVTDVTWKNGILIKKDELNGFFIKGDAAVAAPAIGSRLTFAKSGERTVTQVVVNAPYINIYVDKPLDPVGDGFPNKVKQ
jgi:hypothetical protein